MTSSLRTGGGGIRRRGADRRPAQRQPAGGGDPGRFSHQSTRDLSTLAEIVDTKISHELEDHKSPDDRAQILATSLSQLRPELDLYLMTEIEVEDIAGRLGQHFRQCRRAKCLLDHRQSVVQPPMQRTEPDAMRRQSQGTGRNASEDDASAT